MNEVAQLANMIYGEGANQPVEVMKMMGSSAINRVQAGRAAEFGGDLPTVLQKGYYAVSNPNTPYKQAVEQKFPDQESETKYKQALSIASGLLRGTIKPDEGQFYFTDKEINKLKRNKKAFDFKKVKEVGKVGKYRVFGY
jgi:hypothetical protein